MKTIRYVSCVIALCVASMNKGMEYPGRSFGKKQGSPLARSASGNITLKLKGLAIIPCPSSPVHAGPSFPTHDTVVRTQSEPKIKTKRATLEGHFDILVAAITKNDLKAVETILYNQELLIDLNMQQKVTGDTVLMIAIQHFKKLLPHEQYTAKKIIDVIISKGISDDYKGVSGDKNLVEPLDFAIKNQNGRTAYDLLDPHSPIAIKLLSLTKAVKERVAREKMKRAQFAE